MKLKRVMFQVALALVTIGSAPSPLFAQSGAFGGGYGPPLQTVAPPRAFATSDEHYKFLLSQAKGGTEAHAGDRSALGRSVGTRPATPT